MDTWILVANASRARIFTSPERGKPWQTVGEFEHPESRMKNRDINMKEQGRTKQSFGAGHRPMMEPVTEPKEVDAEHFAHQLANKLTDGAQRQVYEGLVLVAPPHFLGLLRKILSESTQKFVTATVDKDYTASDVRELVERLEGAVYGEIAGATCGNR